MLSVEIGEQERRHFSIRWLVIHGKFDGNHSDLVPILTEIVVLQSQNHLSPNKSFVTISNAINTKRIMVFESRCQSVIMRSKRGNNKKKLLNYEWIRLRLTELR